MNREAATSPPTVRMNASKALNGTRYTASGIDVLLRVNTEDA